MSKEAPTLSSVFNSRVRKEKKIEFSKKDNSLILKALSLIWVKTSKQVESCLFEKNSYVML